MNTLVCIRHLVIKQLNFVFKQKIPQKCQKVSYKYVEIKRSVFHKKKKLFNLFVYIWSLLWQHYKLYICITLFFLYITFITFIIIFIYYFYNFNNVFHVIKSRIHLVMKCLKADFSFVCVLWANMRCTFMRAFVLTVWQLTLSLPIFWQICFLSATFISAVRGIIPY